MRCVLNVQHSRRTAVLYLRYAVLHVAFKPVEPAGKYVNLAQPTPALVRIIGRVESTDEDHLVKFDALLIAFNRVAVQVIRNLFWECIGDDQSYKKGGSTFVETLVTTGQKNDDEIVITDGLNEHDNVVTKGFSAIQQ